jgi:hypothetical protein
MPVRFGAKTISAAAIAAARAAAAAKARVAPTRAPAARAPAAKPKAKAVKKRPSSRKKAAAAISRKEAAFRAKQAKESKALEAQFRKFRTGLEPLDILRQRLAGELGIPELQAQLEPLRGQALRLGQTLLGVPEEIAGRTRGAIVTEAQRRALESARGADLERQLRDVAISQEFFAGQLTGAQAELGQQIGVTQEQREFDLRAFGQQADLLNTRLARELTGYTTQLQRQFEAIIGDIERAEQLSDAERQRAHEFALLERRAAISASQAATTRGEAAQKTARQRKAISTTAKELQDVANLARRKGADATAGIQRATNSLVQRFPEFSADILAFAKQFGGGGFEEL